MAGLGSVSLNMVWNPAIKGSNFLQASMKGIHTYAKSVTKANLLSSTKFPLLNRNMKQLQGTLGHIRTQTAKISASPINLVSRESNTALKTAKKDMNAISHDAKQTAFFTKKTAENLRGTKKPLMHSPTVVQKVNKRRPVNGGVGVASGVGMAYVLSRPFKASIEFETNMADVKALTKNITNKDFFLLATKARKLGATTEWSASQSALGMTFLAKAGFNAKQQLGAMAGVLGLATAGNVDLATSADISSNILSGFGIEAHKMGMVSDVLAKTFTSSNTDLLMLGETMKYTAPIASGLGVGLTEVSALAGKLGDVGIQGSMAGTSLRQAYTRLSAPPAEARKALDSLGVSAFNAQGKFKGMPNIIGELNSSMIGLSDKEKTTKLKHIFGMTALSSGIALLKVGKKGLLDYKATLDNSAGTTKNIQTIKLDTTAGELKLLGSAMESLSISATTGLLPTVNFLTSSFTSVAGKIETFTQKFPNASKWVFGLGTTLVVGTVALATFGFVAGGVATAVGLISLPVLAVVGAISLVVAGGVALYKNWDTIKAKASTVWNDITTKIKAPFIKMFAWLDAKFQKVLQFKNKVLGYVGLGENENDKNVTAPGQKEKSKSFWSSTKSMFGFDDEKIKPANNIKYTAPIDLNSSLKGSIPKVPIESVSTLTNNAVNTHKEALVNNSNQKKEVVQNIQNHITVTAVGGEVDYEDLKEKIKRANKEIMQEENEISFQDAS